MKITKFTHACVRFEWRDRALVVDPGIWSEPAALVGADAVLVTHEHADHIDVMRLAGTGVPVFAPEGARIGPPELLERLNLVRVSSGETFEAAGFEVTATGGKHALIYGGLPECANLGYIVDGRVYHPGDSVHRPETPVEVLCVPMQGSWLKTDEAIDFVKAVRPAQAFGIHDGQLNAYGLAAVNGWLAEETDSGYRYLGPRESMVVDHL
ncbi:L-ascorbate metabolism protein UlaG (beta-lactamase superfamily) [Stackebrandtia albiflava]|uniref:L-ascorbate metabolism protein UlaG (Beta-lactamase superfamily) n=1 Tax=Stackebrandtia albiflava TaxID=406432 RepID=A0A562VD20_9ACTN|nr:MBL fold metallo-hydrolase [Stackebrandtia albiflava]TWJ15770.1 L-ascorbate metabolism protein UlaG (beta-lactamase superfamily) [Stackebrandtia albiflava]